VDASQFRLSPATLQAYLEQGFMLAYRLQVFGGPAFSGALLGAAKVARKSGRFPMEEAPNFGLLLAGKRLWPALRLFGRCLKKNSAIHAGVFTAMARVLAADPCLEALPSPALESPIFADRRDLGSGKSIFPFILRHPDSGRALNREQPWTYTRAFGSTDDYSLRCQLGQPVPCGEREGTPVSALRLSLSADKSTPLFDPNGAAIIVTSRGRRWIKSPIW